MTKKAIAAFAAIAICGAAHASTGKAIVAGAAAGLVVSSVASGGQKQSGVTVFSSAHDTIMCETFDGVTCYEYTRGQTPAQFAGKAGYKFIHKISAAIAGDSRYIVMEVSK